MHSEKPEQHENFDKEAVLLSEIKSIITIEDAEVQKQAVNEFIEKRLNDLDNESSDIQQTISIATNKIESNFIKPSTEIKRNWIVDGFKINDPDIYITLLDNIKKFYQQWKATEVKQVMLNAIIYALGEYFGNYYSNNNTEGKNVAFYSNHTTSDSEVINLNELKGKGIAVCAEKATVAHNYLKFLDFDSSVIFSNNCRLGDTTGGHAYIILATDKGEYIFDPTNPVMVEDENGKISFVKHSLYKISEEDYKNLSERKGNQVSVQHVDQIFDGKQYTNKESQVRIYE